MANHGQYIMMPIKCVGKFCKNCPNLKVDSSVTEYTGNGEVIGTEVDLKCRSLHRCLRIKKMMEEDNDNNT